MNRSLALLVAGCFFMENLDATIVTTAAPSIGRDLGVPATSVGLIITTYVVALAVFIPLGGWLITQYRLRTVFVSAIILFTAASLACGFARDLPTLTALRIVQGIGGAMMVPVGRQAVLRDAPKDQVLTLMSYIVWPGLVAPVIAPVAGGLIATHATWQVIFWLNVPLGMVATAVAVRIVPAVTDSRAQRLDWIGLILIGSGLGGLVWSAHLIADNAGGTTEQTLWVVGSIIGCMVAVIHLRRHPTPIVDVGVLRDRIFGVSQFAVFGFWMTVAAVPFLMPLMMQIAFGWSPVTAGAVVMFVFIGNIAVKPFTTMLLRRYGFRPLLAVSTAGLAVFTMAIGLVTESVGIVVIAALALISGVLRSVALTAFSAVGFATIGTDDRRAANTIVIVIQQVATGLGVAAATVAVGIGTQVTGSATSHTAFVWAFAIVAAVALVPAVAVWALPRDAGAELRPAAGQPAHDPHAARRA